MPVSAAQPGNTDQITAGFALPGLNE